MPADETPDGVSDLLSLRKQELLGLAETEGVEVNPSATKRVIVDSILEHRLQADSVAATEQDATEATVHALTHDLGRGDRDPSGEPSSPTHDGETPWPTALKDLILGEKLNVLLVFIPTAILFEFAFHNETAVFITSAIAIVPLAKLLGRATEELALRTTEGVGGLLNATFGNAVELIIAGLALSQGLILVVQASLVGSIIGNLLLVLGLSFLLGGIKHDKQSFNPTAASANGSLLLLALLALFIPAAMLMSQGKFDQASAADPPQSILNTSHATAVILLISYGLYLYFSLKTHSHLYVGGGHSDHESPTMSLRFALTTLLVSTALVAWMAEMLVASLEHAAHELHLPQVFIGMIIIPVVGNAAEHLSAVTTAMKNKMELSLGIAIGSSTQIALLVAPLMVVLGWILGQPMSLAFGLLETAILFGTVLLVNQIASDGESNWLEGAMLLLAYAVVGVAYLFH